MARDCSEWDPDDCYDDGPPSWEPARGRAAAQAALEAVGLPYSWGGGGTGGPGYGIGRGRKIWGFDCSGLVQYAWGTVGVTIARTSQAQWQEGVRIPRNEVRAGDLVFYDNDRKKPGPEHVGIAINRKRMVNAPFTGARVRVEPLDRHTYLGATRPGLNPDR
ncbi:C40 family peptidase [Nonomuraea sp. NPDC048826]|uniref:C40 family peptidase n=1 Tax=Nonomuraea sp. NPDC048826 TaxID=3364347 RepID=UPI00371C7BAE